MSEITRVPLQPVAKGSLAKVWLGVIVAVLLGIGVAWIARPVHYSDVRVVTLKDGTGKSPTTADVALINYVGRIASTGKEFDRGENAVMPLQGVIPGFSQGLQKMKVGGKYRLEIPAALAYGSQAMPGRNGEIAIPANSDLVFDVELLDFRSAAELQKQQAAMQALQQEMQARGATGGVPGGAMPGGAMPGAPAPAPVPAN